MSKLDGIEATSQILQSVPETKILTLTTDRSGHTVRQTLEAGARGFLLNAKVPTELAKAVTTVAQGGFVLTPGRSQAVAQEFKNDTKQGNRLRAQPTPRQRQIIQLLAQGKVNKEVATILNISVRTAETHRSNIMLKFGFDSIADLVHFAIREGIVPLQGESPRATAATTGQRARNKATTG
jgi:DNA-binding NarL/FixJ family response regulator